MLKEIQNCFSLDRVFYTKHARDEMEAEGFGERDIGEIKEKEVFEAILSGRVIETYPEDEVKSFGSHRNLLSVYIRT